MEKLIYYIILLSITFSCFDPEPIVNTREVSSTSVEKLPVKGAVTNGGIAAKNFTQLNTMYSKLTGIQTYTPNVLSEYKSLELQLPASTDPNSLNGFNQLASTRLAFAYCDAYLDIPVNYANFQNFAGDNQRKSSALIDLFVDMDLVNNSEHKLFQNHLIKILENKGLRANNQDIQLLQNADDKKLLKLGCAAILSSSYLTLI